MEKAYRNLGYFFLFLIPLTFLGFYKTYFNQFPGFKETPNSFIHVHAFIASLWILMLIIQPLLILKKKNKWHKKIGKLSYILFPLLILSFVPQIIRLANSEHPINLFFPVSDSITLIIFYSLAIYHRKKASKHMRYIIGTALVFLGPTVGRIGPIISGVSEVVTQHFQYLLVYSILLCLIFMDKKKNKNYKPYLLVISVFVLHQLVFISLF